MPAGRPSKSEEEKQLQGTFRQDREQAIQQGGQPLTLLGHIPRPPEHFADNLRAQYAWEHVCEELFNVGMLRPLVLDWIELYCLQISDCFRFRELAESEEWVTQYQDEEGNVKNEVISKYVALSEAAYNKAQSTLKLLCLDPATIRKLSPKVPDKAKSKLQLLISKNK